MIVLVNGLDSAKEHMYSSAHWEELAARGISCLMLDQPGTGEALRLQGLTARIDTEAWAGAAVDWLETRDDVDADADRHRRLVARRLLRPAGRRVREALRPVRRLGRQPQLGRGAAPPARARGRAARCRTTGSTCSGCGGTTTSTTFIDFADDVHLDGVVEQITVPFLIAHGANDRQIPLEYAHRSYEQAVNSPKRELRVFTPEEGATEHIGLDHLPHVSTFIADWVADTFAEAQPAVVNTGQPISVRHAVGVGGVAGPDQVGLVHRAVDEQGVLGEVGAERAVGDVDVVVRAGGAR